MMNWLKYFKMVLSLSPIELTPVKYLLAESQLFYNRQQIPLYRSRTNKPVSLAFRNYRGLP